jgi:NADPH-dependent 2,4-dienoyl-CoA reductase/sulfur reductase-like enzyme
MEGDTLASALLANGVRLVGRSFKYHRPRASSPPGPEEPNALVELRTGARREPKQQGDSRSSCTTGSKRRARTGGRRSPST